MSRNKKAAEAAALIEAGRNELDTQVFVAQMLQAAYRTLQDECDQLRKERDGWQRIATRMPAEPILPGEYLRAEMDARTCWDANYLVERSGLPLRTVKGVLAGTKPINAHIAEGLGSAFGQSPVVWLKLQGAYDQAKKRTKREAEHG